MSTVIVNIFGPKISSRIFVGSTIGPYWGYVDAIFTIL